jgi:hypothetical protein
MSLAIVIAINAVLDVAVLVILAAVMAIPFRLDRPRPLVHAPRTARRTAARSAA